MKDPGHERWRAASWRPKLTLAEEAELQEWLARHPEASGQWASERELTHALEQLGNLPVPSNFTARVLAQAQRESRPVQTANRGRSWHTRWRWLPRVALASVVLAAGLLSYDHARDSRRQARAQSVREIVSYTAFPGPEILQDYDAIQAMCQSPSADVELLKALQ